MTREFTVFIVDDNAGVRRSMKNLCEANGLAVQHYPSGEAFLDAYEDEDRGCLLLDIRMRGRSGLEVQEELRARGSALPVVFMTAYGNVASSVRAFKGGATDFLMKPVKPSVGLGCIQRLREASHARRKEDLARLDLVRRLASLTPREREVMDGLIDGGISKEIAFDLGISTRTVEGHRCTVLRKMGVTSAAQLVRLVFAQKPELAGVDTTGRRRAEGKREVPEQRP